MLANLGSVPVSVEIKMASPPFSEKKNSLGKSENEDYAMKKPTTITSGLVSEYRGFIELRLRRRVPEAIELVMEEEVAQALGCPAWGAHGRASRLPEWSRDPSSDCLGA